MQWRRRLGETLRRPFFEVFLGLESCMAGGGRSLLAVFAGLLLGWWIYVPLHELLHAFGCLVAGGEVTRLEIDFLYGGAVLASWIPWVVAGSEYAGRLSGFSTGGSDLVYLITDLAPYLLTLWPGLWAMRLGVRKGWGLLYGAMLPWALASFMSLTGDAYEIGSILLTWIPPWSSEGMPARGRSRWCGMDGRGAGSRPWRRLGSRLVASGIPGRDISGAGGTRKP